MTIEQDDNLILVIDEHSWSDDCGLRIQGWMLSKQEGMLEEVTVCVGSTCVPITKWYPRPDVAAAFPQYYSDNCGFVVNLDYTDKGLVIFEAKLQGKILTKKLALAETIEAPHRTIVTEENEVSNQYFKLDLGCGSNKQPGTLGLDMFNQPGVDYVIDLQQEKLPFPNRSVDYVFSAHFLEHLTPPAPIPIFQEINRVAIDGAHLEFWTPFMWHNSGFIFGHTQYYNEDHYMHLCVWFPDFWQRGLGARWLLKEFVYVVDPEVLTELYKNKIQLEYALKYYKGVVREFGVIIEVRHDYKGETIYPKRTFTTERNRERHLLRPSSKTIDENELQEAINWFSGTE
jgi:hypothetical protein